MSTKFYAVAPQGIEAFECSAPLPQMLLDAGYEQAIPGKIYRKRVACPVNGDGYWYMRQEIVTASGRCVGSIARDDLPSGEL